MSLDCSIRCKDHSRRPVRDWRRRTGCDPAIFAEYWFEPAKSYHGGTRTNTLISGVTFTESLPGNHFPFEASSFRCSRCTRMRFHGVCVHILTSKAPSVCNKLSAFALTYKVVQLT